MNKITKDTLISGICLLYALESLDVNLSWTDLMVLIQLTLQAKPQGVARAELVGIIPRHDTRISGSLTRLEGYGLIEWSIVGKSKRWKLTEEGRGLSTALWQKYSQKVRAVKELL